MSTRDNYYILLELDPAVRDIAGIEKALKERQEYWTQPQNRRKGEATQFFDNIKKIKPKLLELDLEARTDEANAALRILSERKQKEYEELRIAASVVVDEKGEISELALDELVKKFKLKKVEILSAINATVKKMENIEYTDNGIVPLDSSIVKGIKKDLDIVGKKNLFDFLGLTPNSSYDALLEKAKKMQMRGEITAILTATNSLIGKCVTYLKDEPKKKYIKALRLEALEKVYSMVDIAASDGIIDAHEYQKLIEACVKAGTDANIKIGVSEAEYRIHEYCKKKKPVPKIIRSANAEYKKMAQCGICGHLNDKTAANCGNCGNSMKIVCPKCGKDAESANKNCSGCGFTIGGMPNANPLMRDAEVELKKKNFTEARNLLAQAEAYNPKHQNIEKIKAELAKEDDTVQKIREFISAKKFFGLQKEIENLKQIHPNNPDIPKFEKTAKDGIDAADKLCKMASIERDQKKLDLFVQALDKCADFPSALTGVSSCPVDAPSGLIAAADEKSVKLQWRPPVENRQIKYKIIRKEKSAPINQGDGKVLGETDVVNYKDTTAEFYKDYYYAVFSIRGDSMSALIATSTPVVLEMGLEDVKKLKGKKSGDSIYLDWEFPNGCEKVRIEYSHNEGKTTPITTSYNKITYEDKKGFAIKNPEKADFYFTVYACYESAGREYYSKGKDCFVSNSEKIYVSYSVKKSLFSKNANLRLKCKEAPIRLPEIMVVAKRGGFPVSKIDGKCIKTIDGMDMENSVLNIDISLRDIEGCQVRLFSTAGNQKIELLRKE
jgi:hypothetical protein